jgi:hypothetical protein
MPQDSYDNLELPFAVPEKGDIDSVIRPIITEIQAMDANMMSGLDEADILQAKLAIIERHDLYMRGQWLLEPPQTSSLVIQIGHPELRRVEPDAMANSRYWKIQNERSLAFLVTGEASWTPANLTIAAQDNANVLGYMTGIDTEAHSQKTSTSPSRRA